jgi:hypothetical protein
MSGEARLLAAHKWGGAVRKAAEMRAQSMARMAMIAESTGCEAASERAYHVARVETLDVLGLGGDTTGHESVG